MARFRCMADSWFFMVRYYLRVDNVCVRLFDTRLYHKFGTDYIIREFKHQEGSYDQIKQNGHTLNSEWMLSDTQADEVARFVPEQVKINEKLTF